MSSYELRRNGNGTESHRIKFLQDGKRMTRTFVDKKSADSWRALLDVVGPEKALEHLDKPAPTVAQRTVAEQVRHHIEHLTGVEPGTRTKYLQIARQRLSGSLESVYLSDLSRDHVSAWVNAQEGSPKTIKNAHSLLSAALTSAVRDNLLEGNVAKGVKLPRQDQADDEHVYLTKDEVGVLLRLVSPHWRPLVAFLAMTGCRFSEATALAVGSVDVARGQARISRAWKYDPGSPPKLGPPKTRKSRRTISLPPAISAMLELHNDGKKASEFVFVNSKGTPARNGPFHENVWQPIMDEFEELTEKRPRPHDLRHSYASWAIADGISLPVIQRQLGHESITTTVDTYGHLVPSDMDAMAVTIGEGMPAIPLEPPKLRLIGA